MIIGLLFMVALVMLLFFPVVKVNGDSMVPILRHGDILLSKRIFNKNGCVEGKIYVYKPPYDKKSCVIKILNHKEGEMYFFIGGNLEVSVDSRHYGGIASENIVAEIIDSRFWRFFITPFSRAKNER